jgi:acyl carrier protein phosphodiesterase
VNFFSHAVVARWCRDDHGFVFGTMLPDLSAMVGARIAAASEQSVQAGIDYHHATDAAFHGSDPFVRLCSESVEVLTAQGVARGTARAVAHVGFELLLDGLLSRHTDEVHAYEAALAHAREHRLADTMHWTDEQKERLQQGLARLVAAPVPAGYREPAFVVERLQWILARRPRLAMQPGDLPKVTERIQRLSAEVAAVEAELLVDVRRRLRS